LEDSRIALVTGGNRGIGLAIAKRLAANKIGVVIGSRDIRRGQEAAKAIKQEGEGDAVAFALDVTDQSSVDELNKLIRSNFSRLDILVNNAGILLDKSSLPSKTDLQVVRSTLETNLIGAWRLCKSFVPLMKKNRYGRIVNISSGAVAFSTMAESLYAPAYSLSKSALNALTIMLANELGGTNITVNAVCPGWVRTDMGGPNAPRSAEEGADTAVWLATLPDKGPTGGLYFDRSRIEW
jgi:NAD(P)-dependent dehydrogenase (short-subunit alcohol dehydrogenase family)